MWKSSKNNLATRLLLTALVWFGFVAAPPQAFADEVRLTPEQIKKMLAGRNRRSIEPNVKPQEQTDPAARFIRQALQYARARKYERAVKILREAMDNHSPSALVFYHLAWVNGEMEQWGSALEFAQSALSVKPELVDAHILCGKAFTNLGRYEEASESYQKAIYYNPVDSESYNNLGNVFLFLKQYEDALEAYRRSIELKPSDAGTYNNLGETYRQLGRHLEAISAYSKAIERRADFAVAYVNLAASHVALKEYEEAAEALARAVKLDPNEANWRYNFAVLCLSLRNRERAMQQRAALQKMNTELTAKLDRVTADYDKALILQLRRVESELREALKRHNVVVLERLLAKDYVFTGLRRKAITNKAQEIEQSSVLLPLAKILSIESTEESFTPFGNTITVSGKTTVMAELAGEQLCGAFQYERTYDYKEKQWRLIKEKVAPLHKQKLQNVSCRSSSNYLKHLLAVKR